MLLKLNIHLKKFFNIYIKINLYILLLFIYLKIIYNKIF